MKVVRCFPMESSTLSISIFLKTDFWKMTWKNPTISFRIAQSFAKLDSSLSVRWHSGVMRKLQALEIDPKAISEGFKPQSSSLIRVIFAYWKEVSSKQVKS